MTELLSLAAWCGAFALVGGLVEVLWLSLATDHGSEDPWELWQDTGDPVGRIER